MRFGPVDDAGAEGGLYRLLMALALIRRAGFGQALALDAAIVLALATVHDLEDPQIASGTHLATATLFWWLLLLAVWLVGVFVGSRREAAALAARASRLERDAQVAVAEERARMARELHDIVSHNLSVVVAQAAGARAVAERRPGVVSPTLEKIERSGRAALV